MGLLFDHDIYETIREDDVDVVLNSIHHELIIENIKEQLKEPFEKFYTNHLDVYNDRVEALYDAYEDIDIRRSIRELSENTYMMIIKEIQNKFKFEINLSDLDIKSTCSVLYDFFIFNYSGNIKKFYINFIDKNKKSLALNLEANKKNKDIETSINKKDIKNKNCAIIISNFYKALELIHESDIENETFIDYIIADEDDIVSLEMKKLFVDESHHVDFESDIKKTFLKHIIKEKVGYSSILTNIQLTLHKNYTK